MKKLMIVLISLLSTQLIAAGGGAHLESAHTNIRSLESLRNGAKFYMNYCSACHSLQYQRYSRMAEDLGLSKEEATENLIFTQAAYTDHITNNMSKEDGQKWFGKAPPDLTLVTKARGTDWVYSYLKSFYKDPSSKIIV